MTPREVIALDPGEKVGWARATITPEPFDEVQPAHWSNLEHGITPLKDMALALAKRIDTYDVVVLETWRLTPKGARVSIGSAMESSQFVGMVRLLCWLNNTKLVMQSPNLTKTADKTAPDWLREIINHEPSSHDDAHNVDALRHLWVWTWRNYVAKEQTG